MLLLKPGLNSLTRSEKATQLPLEFLGRLASQNPTTCCVQAKEEPFVDVVVEGPI